MESIDGLMGFVFLLILMVIMFIYVVYICNDFFCYSYEIDKEETDKELDIIFSEKFYEEAGRPIKNEIKMK
tara:strand:+ start:619 stop:831 length:213 start_codon:yes stop_codon:yes gene_type:complete